MKTKIATDDDEEVQRFGRKTKKPQSDFMKQLTDLAQQVVELPPPPTPPTQTETITDEIRRQVNLILYLIISIRFYLSKGNGSTSKFISGRYPIGSSSSFTTSTINEICCTNKTSSNSCETISFIAG